MNALNPMDLPHLPTEWARDQRLSYGARGVLAELVDTAPGGEMSIDRLMGRTNQPVEVVEGFVIELERIGYLIRDGECWYLCDPFHL